MPTHTITSRPATKEERRAMLAHTRQGIASYGCLAAFFAAAGVVLAWLGAWLGSFISPNAATAGRCIGAGLSLGLFFYALFSLIPLERRSRRRAAKDWESQIVEELSVSQPRVVEIGLINDNEPILAFEIGEGKLLVLQGQWLRDETTYGAKAPEEDAPFDQYLNGLPPPHSFPSTEFTVVRLSHSGRVLGIRVRGEYLRPSETVEALKRGYDFRDSEILSGRLEDIAGVLAAEHARRSPT